MHTPIGPGAIVWIRQRRWRVDRLRRTRHAIRLDVAGTRERATFIAPFDRPARLTVPRRPRRVTPGRALALMGAALAGSFDLGTPQSAVGAGVALLPFQLEPALAALAGARRILLADEVGLGKTIQAGFIIAETLRRQQAARILAVVPAALRDQWVNELAGRFGLDCAVADRSALEVLGRRGAHGDNPWRRSGLWIASLDFIKQPQVRDALPPLPWDLVVLDEAHDAAGRSDRYDTAQALARSARRVLLLTATPHSGDEERFRRLVALGALDGVDDPLAVFRRTRADVQSPRPRRVSWHRVALSAAERRLLSALGEFERATLAAAGASRREAALLVLSVFRKRALSTAAAAAVSLQRRLSWLDERTPDRPEPAWIQPSLDLTDESDELSDEERTGLLAETGLSPGRERSWLRRLATLAHDAACQESKLARLARLVDRSGEPVIVFTEFRRSLEAAALRLARRRAIAVLHGGQTSAERREQLARFQSGAATALLATDVGGLGLNLQHRSRWVVSLELPWNPARLEQRIGRVDRIGQTRAVHLTLLVARHDTESDLLCRLARRVLAARAALGARTLEATVPAEPVLRRALLDGAPATTAASGRIALCRRWARPARTITRSMERKRRLGRGRRAGPSAARLLWTTSRRTQWLRVDLSRGGLVLFEVPIHDRAGAVIERHVVVLQAPGLTGRRALSDDCLAGMSEGASLRLRGRVRRVVRLLERDAARASAIDDAIARYLADSRVPAEVQPGLFDHRATRALALARENQSAIRRHLVETRGGVIAQPGDPLPRLVVLPRP